RRRDWTVVLPQARLRSLLRKPQDPALERHPARVADPVSPAHPRACGESRALPPPRPGPLSGDHTKRATGLARGRLYDQRPDALRPTVWPCRVLHSQLGESDGEYLSRLRRPQPHRSSRPAAPALPADLPSAPDATRPY